MKLMATLSDPSLTPLGGSKVPPGLIKAKIHRFRLSSNERQMTRFDLPKNRSYGTDLTRPPEQPRMGPPIRVGHEGVKLQNSHFWSDFHETKAKGRILG
jgi:hypothetical protein